MLFYPQTNRSRTATTLGALVVISLISSAVRAATVITADTTQAGGTLTVSPPDELVIHGAEDPLLTLTAGAITSGVEGLVVGTSSGSGRLRIEGGSTLTNSGNAANTGSYGGVTFAGGRGYLALNAGSTGTATITGSGSRWTNTSLLSVGHYGTGVLNIQDGAEVINAEGWLGNAPGSSGAATVTGTGSKWSNAEELVIGFSGNGNLLVEQGGEVSSANGILGLLAGSAGEATVMGTASRWTTQDLFIGGFRTQGTLNIQNGGKVSSLNGLIASAGNSVGTVTVAGNASKWTLSAALTVGNVSRGTLDIQDGGTVEVATTTSVDLTSSLNLKPGGTLKTGSLNAFSFTTPRAFNWTGGTLLITGTSGDIVEVPTAGTLGGTGTINEPVTVRGTLAPGTSIGTLHFSDTTLTLGDDTTLSYEFDADTGDLVNGAGANDILNIEGDGILNLYGVELSSLPLPLFTGFETISGLANLNTWSIYFNGQLVDGTFDMSAPGTISVSAIPEPTSLVLLILGTAILTRRRAGRVVELA